MSGPFERTLAQSGSTNFSLGMITFEVRKSSMWLLIFFEQGGGLQLDVCTPSLHLVGPTDQANKPVMTNER